MKKFVNPISIIIGIFVGISLSLITLLFIDDTNSKTNSIRIMSALINSLVLLSIAVYFNRSQTNTKSLKEYFITDISEFRIKYSKFLDDINENKFMKRDLIAKNKEFSMHSNQVTHIVKKELNIDSTFENKVHKIYNILAGTFERIDDDRKDYFDSIDDDAIVTLSKQQKYLVAKEGKDLSLLLKYLVVNITRY